MGKGDIDNIEVRVGAGGPRYRVRWQDTAGRHSRTFGTEREARVFLAEMEVARARGTYSPPAELTVGDVIREHIERSEGRVQPSTIRGWTQYLRDHVPHALQSRRAAEMRTVDWQRWVDGLMAKGLAPGTVQPVVSMVMGALNGAVRSGQLERNTLSGVRLPTIRRPRVEVWSGAEVRRVLAAVQEDPAWHAVYLLALTTGLRPGELRALHWADLRGSTLHVHRTVAKKAEGGLEVREGTKRGDGRHVALAAPVVAALQRWREVAPEGVYLFGGDKPLPNMRWQRYHLALIERLGVRGITLHGMRHSCATLLLEQGVHPKVVGDVLGHSNIATTLDIYSHVSVDLQRAAADMLAMSLYGVEHDNMDTGKGHD